MQKTILITGASGFLGKHLVSYILENTDWNIVNLDRRYSDTPPVERVKEYCIQLDALNPISGEILKDINYVIHLAAEKDVRKSYLDLTPYLYTNVLGTNNLLEWIKRHPVEKMINFSTAAVLGPVFGEADFIQQSRFRYPQEFDDYAPNNPYAASKACQELLCIMYARAFKLPIINARIDTPFGEYQPEANFVPFAVKKLLYNQDVPLYGKTHKEVSVNKDNNVVFIPKEFVYSQRNWIHPFDISKALVELLKGERIGTRAEQFNFHLVGNKYNVRELLSKIAKCMGIEEDTYKVVWTEMEPDGKSDSSLIYGLDSEYHLGIHRLHMLSEQDFDERLKKTTDWLVATYRKQEVNETRILS